MLLEDLIRRAASATRRNDSASMPPDQCRPACERDESNLQVAMSHAAAMGLVMQINRVFDCAAVSAAGVIAESEPQPTTLFFLPNCNGCLGP